MYNPFRKQLHLLQRIRTLRRVMRVSDAFRLILSEDVERDTRIFLKPLGCWIIIRSGTTDLKCLEKVFLSEEYRPPFDSSPRVIVDAGANVGMATLYFANKFPDAQIIAIEPESSNFDILRRNCADLAKVTLMQAALWPNHRDLEIADCDVSKWEFRVGDRHGRSSDGETVAAVTVADLLAQIDTERIDLLKIDIEGSELELFAAGADQWLHRIHIIAIELHDRFKPGCAEAFYGALTSRKFVQEINGENIFVRFIS
jgi:FkbM family methyltransferase